jgi:segregation and condensation protein A
MSANYQVKTEIFSGPIELLLYLARKNEVDIFDVPLAIITEDYLNYLQQVQNLNPAPNSNTEGKVINTVNSHHHEHENRCGVNIEVSSDFLLMAVVLIRLKMWRLLPSTQDAEQVPETVSLEDIINEYKKYADVAGYLSDLEAKRLQFFPRRGQIIEELPDSAGDVYVLVSAFQKVLEKNIPRASYEIPVLEIKLEDKINELRELFIKKTKIRFSDIVEQVRNLTEIIIMFIALLELIRLSEIRVIQNTEFGEIILEKRFTLDDNQ